MGKEVDIDLSVLGSWEEIATDNLEADSTGTFGNELVMQYSAMKDLGCKRDRECDNALQWQSTFDKELRPGIQIQQNRTTLSTDQCKAKVNVTLQGLPGGKAKDWKDAAGKMRP